MQHAAKVAKRNDEVRPVLKGAYHSPAGHIYVTDTHVAYRLLDGSIEGEEYTIDFEGNLLEDQYPNIARTFEGTEDQCVAEELITDVKIVAQVLKNLLVIEKKLAKNTTDFALTRIYLQRETGIQLTSSVPQDSDFQYKYVLADARDSLALADEEAHLRLEYLSDAFAMFAAAKKDSLTLKFIGKHRPILLEADDLTAMILPVRVYK